MKKIKLNGKLKLNKETIAKLNDEQMNSVKGGDCDVQTGYGMCLDFATRCCYDSNVKNSCTCCTL